MKNHLPLFTILAAVVAPGCGDNHVPNTGRSEVAAAVQSVTDDDVHAPPEDLSKRIEASELAIAQAERLLSWVHFIVENGANMHPPNPSGNTARAALRTQKALVLIAEQLPKKSITDGDLRDLQNTLEQVRNKTLPTNSEGVEDDFYFFRTAIFPVLERVCKNNFGALPRCRYDLEEIHSQETSEIDEH